MKVHNLVVTGSLTSGGENISTISSSVSTTVTELSSSLTSSIGSLSSSMVTMVDTMSSSMSSRFDTVQSTTSSLNSFTSSATGRLNSVEGKTGSYATTGSNTFVGLQTIQGSIVPASHATYDLGSAGYNFRHLYLSSASLYIDGTKVLGSTTQELQITTDNGQSFKILEAGSDTITLQSADGNITLATSGGGDVILDPTSGIIALKGTTTIYAGNKVLSSDGNPIHFGNSVTMTGSLIVTGYIETQELRTTYISSSILYRSGSTKFGDELTDTHAFSGSVSISGSLSVPESGLISGSSQVLNGSGVWSGSAQLPSGVVSGSSQVLNGTTIHSGSFFNGISVVSGSAQIDVLSTTNIARLATTGSNNFSGTQTFGYGRLVSSGYNSSAQITINAAYDGGQTNTYTADYAGDGSAGMFVMKQSDGGYGNFYFYGKQHGTTGGSHALSSFNPIMGMNANGRVAIGKLTANTPLDVNGNTLVTGSITSTANVAAGTTISWNGGVGALSYGGGTVTMETNSTTPILLKTNGTTAITISTGQTVTFANSITSVGLTNNGTYSQSTSSTQPVMIYGDSAGINGLFRVQIDEVNDSFGSGARTFLGDGGIDIFLGTGNSSYTPANTYIALNHGGEISMGAGSATKHFTLTTSGGVGINTTSPGARLEVKANDSYASANQSNIKLTNTGYRNDDLSSYGEGAYLDFYFENYNDAYGGTVYDRVLDIVVKGSPDGTYGKGVIRFKANPKTVSSNSTEIMRIQGDNKVIVNGNIGINITNPTQKLEIGNGNLRLTEIGTSSFDISYSGGKVQFGTDSAGTQGYYFRTYSGGYADRFIIKASGEVNVAGSILPTSDASYNLGSTSLRWNNLYTTDLHLSNEGKQNVVDGTWGDWTLQEGENDIYMLNNRSGEKFKIKLEKI